MMSHFLHAYPKSERLDALCTSKRLFKRSWREFDHVDSHFALTPEWHVEQFVDFIGNPDRGVRIYEGPERGFMEHREVNTKEQILALKVPFALYLYDRNLLSEWLVLDLDSKDDPTQAQHDLEVAGEIMDYCGIPWFGDVSDNGGFHLYAHLDKKRHLKEFRTVMSNLMKVLYSLDRSVMNGGRACIRPTGAPVKSGKGYQFPLHHFTRVNGVLANPCSVESYRLLADATWLEMFPGVESEGSAWNAEEEALPVEDWEEGRDVKVGYNPGTPGGRAPHEFASQAVFDSETYIEEEETPTYEELHRRETELNPEDPYRDSLIADFISDEEISQIRRLRIGDRRSASVFTIPEYARALVFRGDYSGMPQYEGDDSRARQGALAYLYLAGYSLQEVQNMVRSNNQLVGGYVALMLNGNHGSTEGHILRKLESDFRGLERMELFGQVQTRTGKERLLDDETPVSETYVQPGRFVLQWLNQATRAIKATDPSVALQQVLFGIARIAARQNVASAAEVFEMSYRHLARYTGLSVNKVYQELNRVRTAFPEFFEENLMTMVEKGKEERGTTWVLAQVNDDESPAHDPGPMDPIWSTAGPLGKQAPALRRAWEMFKQTDVISEVAETLSVSRPTIGSYVARLVEIGLLVKTGRGRAEAQSMWDLDPMIIWEAVNAHREMSERTMRETHRYMMAIGILNSGDVWQIAKFMGRDRIADRDRKRSVRTPLAHLPRRRLALHRPIVATTRGIRCYDGRKTRTTCLPVSLIRSRGDPHQPRHGPVGTQTTRNTQMERSDKFRLPPFTRDMARHPAATLGAPDGEER